MAEKFKYDYEAPTIKEREEIDSIRKQYLPKSESENKFELLKKLDNKVKEIPMIVSLSLGIIGILLFGTGMCFFLQWIHIWFFGIPFSIIGVIIMILAYPMYNKLTNYLKDKYKDQIISLSEELLKDDSND